MTVVPGAPTRAPGDVTRTVYFGKKAGDALYSV